MSDDDFPMPYRPMRDAMAKLMRGGAMGVFLPGNKSVPVVTTRADAPELTEMQTLIGGYIELVWQGTTGGVPVQVWCDEEGRLKGLAENGVGTYFTQIVNPRWDEMLVGPVVVLVGIKVVCQ